MQGLHLEALILPYSNLYPEHLILQGQSRWQRLGLAEYSLKECTSPEEDHCITTRLKVPHAAKHNIPAHKFGQLCKNLDICRCRHRCTGLADDLAVHLHFSQGYPGLNDIAAQLWPQSLAGLVQSLLLAWRLQAELAVSAAPGTR